MELNKYTESIIRVPLSLFIMGKKYLVEVTGSREPLGRYFICHIPGSSNLVIEAIARKPKGGFLWASTAAHELGNCVNFIGRQVERYLGNTGNK